MTPTFYILLQSHVQSSQSSVFPHHIFLHQQLYQMLVQVKKSWKVSKLWFRWSICCPLNALEIVKRFILTPWKWSKISGEAGLYLGVSSGPDLGHKRAHGPCAFTCFGPRSVGFFFPLVGQTWHTTPHVEYPGILWVGSWKAAFGRVRPTRYVNQIMMKNNRSKTWKKTWREK